MLDQIVSLYQLPRLKLDRGIPFVTVGEPDVIELLTKEVDYQPSLITYQYSRHKDFVQSNISQVVRVLKFQCCIVG